MSRPELRLVLALSLDGRLAPADGGPAGFGGPGDRRALEEALAWADAALIGAGTLRSHGSTCLIHGADLLAERARQGQAPQPAAVVVSGRAVFPPALPFFAQPLRRWLLAPPGRPRPEGFERLLPLEGWDGALAQLAALGVARLLVLGGAQLAGALLAADRIDELQLTLCPLLLGGRHSWLPADLPLPPAVTGPERWALLEQRALGAGELLLRYRRRDGSSASGGVAVPLPLEEPLS